MKTDKTNVMRLLDEAGIPYSFHVVPLKEAVDGVTMAAMIGKSTEMVFKTLVLSGASGSKYVFVIPVGSNLNLKKAAAAAREKSVCMLPQKDLLPLTGYVHGGCSPIGMKKQFPSFLDESAILCDTIVFSAGKIGYQVELSPDALISYCGASPVDLT